MEGQSKSGTGALARFRAWRKKRRLAAAKRRGRAEEQIAQERYNYSGPGAPGGGG
jgi:hypothetical protein